MLQDIATYEDDEPLRSQGSSDRTRRTYRDGQPDDFNLNRMDVLLSRRVRRRGHGHNVNRWQIESGSRGVVNAG